MSTSIPVLNRNHSLPPLLLPASRSMKNFGNNTDARQDPFNCYSISNSKRRSSLESLAQLATKRPRTDSIIGDSNLFCGVSDIKNGVVPVALFTSSPVCLGSSTVPKSGFVSSSSSGSSSPSNVDLIIRENGASAVKKNVHEIQTNNNNSNKLTPSQPAIVTCPSPERSRRRSSTGGTSKRQRVGPSCDGCRLKKIKCDAQVEIILQDPKILTLLSDKLHQVISRDQVSQMDLHKDISEIPEDSVLVKHIDKIVMFRPCRSCNKHRASMDSGQVPLDGKNNANNSNTNNNNNNNVTGGGCIFSKGFTRADINVFAKICKRVGEKSVQEMTVEDYREAGF